jgi:hypothetical protein
VSDECRESRIDEEEFDDFEFSLIRDDLEISADEITIEAGVRPIFPSFNRELLVDDRHINPTLRFPSKKMFLDEHETVSCSSSEDEDTESIAPGKYCVWRSKMIESSPNRVKKSSSTGSGTKKWNFLNFLRRSNSDGKDAFVFLTPKNKAEKSSNNSEKVEISKPRRSSVDSVQVAGKAKAKGITAGNKLSAHEVFYVQNRAKTEGSKKKSYLPYRPDLVGFFANTGSLGPAAKTIPPFY